MSPRNWLATTAVAASFAMVALPAASAPAPAPARSPFATASALPFEAPRFDLIKDSDYQPGYEQGMAIQRAEMQRIANNPAAPTFDNTIVAMERSGRMLERVGLAFSGVVGANTNPVLDKVQEVEAPRLAAHQDAIYLNPKLFARVKTLYDQRARQRLDPEQRQLLEVYYHQFVHAGAQLSEPDKAKLRALNGQISTLETAFQQKLVAAAKAGALVVDSPAKLAGLDEGAIAAAAQAAKDRKLDGKWVVPLQNTTQQPTLSSLSDRSTREALFNQSWNRAEKGDANDTRSTIEQLAQLRAQKAALLGYPNWAAYVLSDQMAVTPEAVQSFIGKLAPATAAEERREAAIIQAAIKAGGEDFKLRPWDWDRYAERVRKAKYDLDESEIKPYFELNRVLQDGVFYAAGQLYGISFKERKDIPVYQPDVRVFQVYDKDGSELGLIYFDYFKRDNKSGGAWMSNFVNQSRLL
ncbi:MAG: peptidyl-dipeptidase Dcp, partial [Sphingomonadales bacterium]|nr:peptidyl-dipeptidase Dcp [Sphingomonadales bacterium]